MQYLSGTVDEIVTRAGERRVTLQTSDGRFNAFDGYKTGNDGIARLGSAEWMQGQQHNVVVLATVAVTIDEHDGDGQRIESETEEQDSYHGNIFRGHIEKCVDDISGLLTSCSLYGDIDTKNRGIPLDETPFDGLPAACLTVGSGTVLVDLSVVETANREIADAQTVVEVRPARTDLLGFVD